MIYIYIIYICYIYIYVSRVFPFRSGSFLIGYDLPKLYVNGESASKVSGWRPLKERQNVEGLQKYVHILPIDCYMSPMYIYILHLYMYIYVYIYIQMSLAGRSSKQSAAHVYIYAAMCMCIYIYTYIHI